MKTFKHELSLGMQCEQWILSSKTLKLPYPLKTICDITWHGRYWVKMKIKKSDCCSFSIWIGAHDIAKQNEERKKK